MLIDIAPTLDTYEATALRLATAYCHWFFLIQPTPRPERMIEADPLSYLHWKLGGWGAGTTAHIEPEALAQYERCFSNPAAIHGACEDYRASAGIDLEHERAVCGGARWACAAVGTLHSGRSPRRHGGTLAAFLQPVKRRSRASTSSWVR